MARTVWETIEVTGNELAEAVRKLIEAGNVRRIRIRQRDKTIAEFPLTIGVVGAVFAPMLAAIGALAALVTDCTIDVEREVDESRVQSPESRVQGPGARIHQRRPEA